MADSRQGDFEFFKILLPGMLRNKLRIPSKFAEVLGDRQQLKMRLASGGAMPLWDVEIVSNDDGVDLGRGWSRFVRTYDLRAGHLLVLRCYTAVVLTVTVFDPSGCRKQYPHAAGGASAGTNAPHINEPAHFAVTLRKCNLQAKQKQYLAMVRGQNAERAGRVPGRPRVRAPASGGASDGWAVMDGEPEAWQAGARGPHGVQVRVAPVSQKKKKKKYGWHQFCVDNNLEVGDTCFFRVVRERNDCKEEDKEWKEEEEDDEHVLKVEVRKKDGAFVA